MRGATLVAAVALVCLSACENPCGNEIVRELPSPDQKSKAVLFTQNCGVTTDYTSQVSILSRGEAFSADGNAFIADSNHGAAETIPQGGPVVSMTWTAPDALLVTYANQSRVFLSETQVRNVSITYREETP